MYTTEYLLKNADIVTELCTKEKEEFRIWTELKRAFKEMDRDEAIGVEIETDKSVYVGIDNSQFTRSKG